MKWILIVVGGIVGLIVLAILVLLTLGLRKDAGRMAGSVEIDRPPQEVWPYLTDADKLKQWVSWLSEVRDETPEIQGPGKKVVWIMDDPNMKQKVEIHGEIVAEEPLRMSSVKLSSELGFDGLATWRLTDLGGRTRFDSESSFRYRQWIPRLFEPLITPQARKKMQADAAKLKSVIEAQPALSLR